MDQQKKVKRVSRALDKAAGLGIIAFPVSQFVGLLMNASVAVTMSRALGLLPQKECWGRVNSQTFGEIFSFSRDVFVLGLALQIISASQVIMVSRFLGLEAAATWSICTKVFQFAQQIVYRLFDFSSAALSEMVVRREIERFKQRYASMVTLTASAAVLFAILGMAANFLNSHVFWIFAVGAATTGAVGIVIFYLIGLQRPLKLELNHLLVSLIRRSPFSSG